MPALFGWLGQQGIGLGPGGLLGWILIKPINAEQQIMPSFYILWYIDKVEVNMNVSYKLFGPDFLLFGARF